MIGTLSYPSSAQVNRGVVSGAAPIAVLEDDGRWLPYDPSDVLQSALSQYLDSRFHPVRNAGLGDHRLPFGLVTLNAAADVLGLVVTLQDPIPPLPDGAVS